MAGARLPPMPAPHGGSRPSVVVVSRWPAVAGCVGVFRIEGLGVQLFESIAGDNFTVLGMPLLAVLGALREQGELAA